jgi:hypothetical protein
MPIIGAVREVLGASGPQQIHSCLPTTLSSSTAPQTAPMTLKDMTVLLAVNEGFFQKEVKGVAAESDLRQLL